MREVPKEKFIIPSRFFINGTFSCQAVCRILGHCSMTLLCGFMLILSEKQP